MTKYLLPICICLGGLVLLTGCTGAATAPPQPRVEAAQPIQSPKEPNAAAEPKEAPPTPQSHVPEPNKPATTVEKEEAAEPNEVKPVVPAANKPDVAKADANDNPQSPLPAAGTYAELLQNSVQEDGAVDYSSLRRRRLELKQMLMELGELDPNSYEKWSDDEKAAFWINTYNLKLFDIIARNYPIQSSWWLRLTWPPSDIRHIPGIWTDFKFVVMGEEFTLAEVERRFFHRTFGDPRVYLAINYAGRSGPPMRRTPYDGEHLARQLDEQVKAFLASPQGLRIDRQAMIVYLSAIFKPTWRGKEFVARYGTDRKFKDRDPETRAVLSFISGYLSREDAYFLETENYAIEYMNFDWRLNDTSRNY